MESSFLEDMIADLRMSVGSLLAIWRSLLLPAGLFAAGLVALGGGVKEVLAVALGLALFSLADLVILNMQLSELPDEEAEELRGISIREIARLIRARYF
ncbi:MAG: hypothetical protein V2I43_01795 [Parvularcula sp.]|jgi:hypothetical protein|nr:hypothetical protein [Parvularcula sp.]